MRNINERPLCHRAEDLVTYLYGEAGQADEKDFVVHMQSCDACRSEFAVFQQVHDSILQWRSEALGAVSFVHDSAPAPIQTSTAVTPTGPGLERRLSAAAALREFFNVSPLWLKGATALASIAFCLLVVFAVSRYWTKPATTIAGNPDQKVFSPTEFQAAVNHEVEKRIAEINKPPTQTVVNKATTNDQPRRVRKQNAAGLQLVHSRLTRKEREQLAADLRLLPTSDDDDLPFVLPNEPNQ